MKSKNWIGCVCSILKHYYIHTYNFDQNRQPSFFILKPSEGPAPTIYQKSLSPYTHNVNVLKITSPLQLESTGYKYTVIFSKCSYLQTRFDAQITMA